MFNCINVFPYRNLILHKAWADFRADGQRTYLGILWWVIQPLINIGVYYLVFGLIFKRGGENYIPNLAVGVVAWQWFSSTILSTNTSILRSMPFVRQVAFPKIIFPLCVILNSTLQFFFSLLVLFFVLALFGFTPDAYMAALPGLLLIELLLIMGVTLPLCAIVPFIPDVAKLVEYVLRIMFFLSCVFYTIESYPEKYRPWVLLNPMVTVITGMRDILINERWPDMQSLGITVAASLVFIYIGAWLISRFEKIYAKRVTS